jgi:hypothetical protein
MTYRQLERRAALNGTSLPYSTIAHALGRERLPREELLIAIVRACGCDAESVALWVQVRRRLATRSTESERPIPRTPAAAPHDSHQPEPARSAASYRPARGLGIYLKLLWALGPLCALIGASPVSAPEMEALPPEPVAWWRFEEPGGTTAFDSSKSSRSQIVIKGDAERVAVPGGHALWLDGTSHATTTGPLVRTDKAFTITAWLRLDTGDAWGTVISQHDGAYDALLLSYDPDKTRWEILVPNRTTGWALGDETVYSAIPARTKIWTHLSAVYDPTHGQLRLYVNGDLDAIRPRRRIVRATGPMDIGQALENGKPVDRWHGAIDDVRVFDQPLTRSQIEHVMNIRT